MVDIMFWFVVTLIVYPYALYPVILILGKQLIRKQVNRGQDTPTVTVLIAAFNEADCIKETIRNKLEQNYPQEKLEIIVISDGSTDGTDEIVEKFKGSGVKLIRQEINGGKAVALNDGVKNATGEILIFSDANSIFSNDTITKLVENFSDPNIGYVTGLLTYSGSDGSLAGAGCRIYMIYENLLRKVETAVGSVIGVNGGVDAIRRELYKNVPQSLITDFVLPLQVIESRHRVIFDERAISCETPNEDVEAEFRMRVRVALRALQGLVYMKKLTNPLNFPVASFCILSHKWLRYLAPFFMLAALLLNIFLAKEYPVYQWLLAMHIGLYGLGLLGISFRCSGLLHRATVLPAYFLLSNTAFLIAIMKFLQGETMATWKPRVG